MRGYITKRKFALNIHQIEVLNTPNYKDLNCLGVTVNLRKTLLLA